MPQYRRIVALLITLLLLIGLVGCGRESNAEQGTLNPDNTTASETSSKESVPEKEACPAPENRETDNHSASAQAESTSNHAGDVESYEPYRPDTGSHSDRTPGSAPQSSKNDKEDPLPQPPKQDESSKDPDPEQDEPDSFKLSDVQPIIKENRYQYNPYLLSKEAIRCFDIGFFGVLQGFPDRLYELPDQLCLSQCGIRQADRYGDKL